MKKKITLLMMAALLAVSGVQAGTRTVRRYLRLTDGNITKYWNENDRTSFDIRSNTVIAADITAIENHGNGNIAVGWDFDSNKCIGNYTKLVVNVTSQTNTNGLNFVLSENGYWGRDAHAKTWIIEAGENKTLEIDLTGNYTTDTESNTLDVSMVNMLCFVTEHQTADEMSFTLGDVYLEKEVDDASYKDFTTEPFDITNYTFGGLTSDHGYVTTTDANPNIGWDFNTGLDMSDYRYLVIVPKYQWAEGAGVPNIQINMCNYSDGNIGDAITDIKWISGSNPRRAVVLDLQSDSKSEQFAKVTPESLGRLYVTTPWAKGKIGLSAVYLTNTAPTWSSEPYNNTDATTRADYYRAATTAGTWGTVCLPYKAAVCGADIYEVVGVDSKDSPSVLYLEQVDGIMTAGKAYLYKTNSNQTHHLDSPVYYTAEDEEVINGTKNVGDLKSGTDAYYETGNVTFYRVSDDDTTTPTGENLKGTFTGATVPNDGTSYILKSGLWKRVNGTTNTVGANRAYLTLTESLVVPAEEALAKGFITMNLEDGTATGIGLTPMDDVESSKFNVKSSKIFNLTGQRVSKLQKGVNIVNGKKVLVK